MKMLKEKTLDEKIIFIDNLIASTFSKKMHLYYCDIIEEIERLNNIIKEAIEYIEQVGIYSDYGDSGIQSENDLLKILKGDKND
jgi:hypothetical protein